MTPRRYDKRQRAVAMDETRRRILTASLSLHGEKGFEATSWKDIAARADVAVGTVYYHFPSIDDLVPACGALAKQLARLPSSEIFEGLPSRSRRIEALVREVFAYYSRVAPGLGNVFRERHKIPAVNALAVERERLVNRLLKEALGKGTPPSLVKCADALMDFRVWDSFRSRGVAQEVIVSTVATLIQSLGSSKEESRPR